jgi:riboflavin kinase
MPEKLVIKGYISSGSGDGKYYMSLRNYRESFAQKLGYEPYMGTLNLKLFAKELLKLSILRKAEGIVIRGFQTENRIFGSVKCFPARLRGLICAVILPEKTTYRNVLEVIAEKYLRATLGLKDGELVEVEVFL